MKERPILFTGAMVRALLDGSKTQTRRVVKSRYEVDYFPLDLDGPTWPHLMRYCDYIEPAVMSCPYGQPGDRLWVRETFCHLGEGPFGMQEIEYRADGECDPNVVPRWTPSIHMPRAASRILLEITGVRVERLQDISKADAIAEGVEPHEVRQFALFGLNEDERAALYRDAAVGPYRGLWESINGAGSWDADPWVWVVEFRRLTP